MNRTQQQDKLEILQWLETNCNGFRNARTRENILPFVLNKHLFPTQESKDRYFRKIVSELRHEGHIASSCERGYWFVPLVTDDPAEIEAVKHSIFEVKAKALDMLQDCEKHLQRLEAKLQGQKVMF